MLNVVYYPLMYGVFITFSGNCRRALTFYQTCFGGTLQFLLFEKRLLGYPETPVVKGSLVSENIVIHGSDLVHNEGRKIGNYISIFLGCRNSNDRKELIEKLLKNQKNPFIPNDDQELIEITDSFDVKWVLSI